MRQTVEISAFHFLGWWKFRQGKILKFSTTGFKEDQDWQMPLLALRAGNARSGILEK